MSGHTLGFCMWLSVILAKFPITWGGPVSHLVGAPHDLYTQLLACLLVLQRSFTVAVLLACCFFPKPPYSQS